MRLLLTALCAALSGCAQPSLPGDVLRFIEQRDACDHFRGEFPDPPDPVRSQEILAMISQYCTGTDAQLEGLRRRYQANASVTTKLTQYETLIEKKRK